MKQPNACVLNAGVVDRVVGNVVGELDVICVGGSEVVGGVLVGELVGGVIVEMVVGAATKNAETPFLLYKNNIRLDLIFKI